ncbi:MAG: hypothetical protein GEU88_13305, partial [Solirubrobacterales bacterium]|nr:hypothetical protein [Solirubrobacterales bacterium]
MPDPRRPRPPRRHLQPRAGGQVPALHGQRRARGPGRTRRRPPLPQHGPRRPAANGRLACRPARGPSVKPPPFDYAAPDSIDEAVALLAGELDATVLAGGQSLVPLLSMRLAQPDLLVDLRRIEGLDRISESDGHLAIGAMVRQLEAETNATVRARCSLLVEALAHVAHPQIRARGTVCGSVAHADPAAELPAVVVALDARIRVRGPGGERVVGAADLYRGMLTTSLAPGEVVTAVELPLDGDGDGAACVEVARREGDYAICGAVARVSSHGGAVAEARLALFGLADRPVRA